MGPRSSPPGQATIRRWLAGAEGLPPVELARDLTTAAGSTIGSLLPVRAGPDRRAAIVVRSAADLPATIQPLGYLLAGTP